LALAHPLPLAAGDVGLLRDPGAHRIAGRVTVLDTEPPPLLRRGAAAARARDLEAVGEEPPDGDDLLRRRKVVRVGELRGLGAEVPRGALAAGEWLVDPEHAATLRARLARAVAEHRRAAPLEPGPTVEAVRSLLDLPDRAVVPVLAAAPLTVRDGRVVDATAPPPLPPAVAEALAALREDLRANPFAAPEARRLAALGLGPRELAVAEHAGAVLRVADGVVLLPGADTVAAGLLAGLPQPFTLSEARQALGTTRRVAVPLLELLDRRRLTRRLPDDRRSVTSGPAPPRPGGAPEHG
jgi:selenocysteine-specific elongation factor